MTPEHAPSPRTPAPAGASRRGRRVLLAWELGEGLGHAARLLFIAERLRAQGWSPVVAARQPNALHERYAAAQVPVIPAPPCTSCHTGPAPFRAASYADIMGLCGYADPARLAAAVAAWDAVLDEHLPDLVIADYSPLLSLAVFGRIPLIAVGDGFVTPHELPGGQFPPLRDAAPPTWDPQRLLETAQAVQAARRRPRPATLPQIVAGMAQVVSVPPELDIHATTRAAPAAGPWDKPLPPLAPIPGVQVFCYLRAHHPQARQVLQVLAEQRIPAECYLHDADAGLLATLQQGGVRVHAHPPPLRDALARASLLVHHAGIGSLEQAALAGRPQLLLPRHLEQTLNTRRALATLPGTATLREGLPLERLHALLPQVVRNPTQAQRARQCAARLTARPETAWERLYGLACAAG